MNLVAFTAVGVRLLALVMFFYVLRETSRLVSLAAGSHSYEEWPLYAIFIAVFVVVGVWLWIAAVNLAKRIVPKDVAVESELSDEFARPIYQLAFVLLGLYVLVGGVSEFSYTAQVYVSLPEEYMTPDQVRRLQAAMVSASIEALIGLVLVVGAKGVSAVIYKIRYGGQ